MNVTTTLDSVTVYRRGALCLRTATLEAPKGVLDTELRLVGLPLSLVPGSLRARVNGGPEGLRVLDVRPGFEVALRDEVDAPAEQQALEAAGEELNRLETAINRVESRISELESLRPQFVDPKEGDPPRQAAVGTMLALADFVTAQLQVVSEERRKLGQERDDAREAVRLHEQRLREASTAQRTERAQVSRCAVVTLSQPPPAGASVAVEYEVPGARWTPGYELKLAKGFTGGELALRASVAQRTGEDWSGVKLALSTASLSRRSDVPELRSLRIGRTQLEPPRPAWREPPPGLEALFEGYDSSQANRPRSESTRTGGVTTETLGLVKNEMVRMEKAKKKAGRAPAAPPPPPAPRGGPGGGGVPMPSSMAPPAAMPAMAPQMQAAASGMAFGGAPPMARSRSAPRRSRAMDEDDLEMEMPMAREEMAGAMADEGWDEPEPVTGVGLVAGLQAEPEVGVAADLLDYGRLTMSAPDAGGARGKLVPMSQWEHVFVASISVSVDVVVSLVARAQQHAASVDALPLPANCHSVGPLNAFDYRYDCAARVDVASTGAWQTVPVMACAVELKPEYVTVPSLEQKVYRTLLVKNATPHALLAGPVDVSAGDEFLLTTTLPPIPPGADSLRLGLGVEEAIKVARKTQYRETTGGFLGGSAVLPHELSIELNNRLSTPAVVEVRERVPVPEGSEKDLKVEEEKIEPAWEKVEGLLDGQVVPGTRRWRVTVPPGQRQTLSAQFTIRMPADRMLVGGNRRL